MGRLAFAVGEAAALTLFGSGVAEAACEITDVAPTGVIPTTPRQRFRDGSAQRQPIRPRGGRGSSLPSTSVLHNGILLNFQKVQSMFPPNGRMNIGPQKQSLYQKQHGINV